MKRIWIFLIAAIIFMSMPVFAGADNSIPKPGIKPTNQSCYPGKETSGKGMASWYGAELHGQRTANGGRFNMHALTAAHRTLPFGTRVQVKNRRNGRSVVVIITDRGPYAAGRIIDVSLAAARKLGFASRGVAPVEIWRCIKKPATVDSGKYKVKEKNK